MQRPHVPKFGTWDANANGPAYTAVFDHARTGKGGKPFNPNDPAENEAAGVMMGGPPQRPPARGRMAASSNDQGKIAKLHKLQFILCCLLRCRSLPLVQSF